MILVISKPLLLSVQGKVMRQGSAGSTGQLQDSPFNCYSSPAQESQAQRKWMNLENQYCSCNRGQRLMFLVSSTFLTPHQPQLLHFYSYWVSSPGFLSGRVLREVFSWRWRLRLVRRNEMGLPLWEGEMNRRGKTGSGPETRLLSVWTFSRQEEGREEKKEDLWRKNICPSRIPFPLTAVMLLSFFSRFLTHQLQSLEYTHSREPLRESCAAQVVPEVVEMEDWREAAWKGRGEG